VSIRLTRLGEGVEKAATILRDLSECMGIPKIKARLKKEEEKRSLANGDTGSLQYFLVHHLFVGCSYPIGYALWVSSNKYLMTSSIIPSI
jgi:hypothetical protein